MISSDGFGRKTACENQYSLAVHLKTVSKNVFPLAVLESGLPISFHRYF
jgi:hypothetical protein